MFTEKLASCFRNQNLVANAYFKKIYFLLYYDIIIVF